MARSPAQERLLQEVRTRAAAGEPRCPLRVARGGYKTADVLIASGALVEATEAEDYTRWVRLPT